MKDAEMGAASVAMIVASRAPRKTPTQMLPSVMYRRVLEISSGMIVCSVVGWVMVSWDGLGVVWSLRRGVSSPVVLGDKTPLDGGLLFGAICYVWLMVEAEDTLIEPL